MKITISTKKKSAGSYEVSVMSDHKLLGTFNESAFIDDIHECIHPNGSESELMGFDYFDDVYAYCISKATPVKEKIITLVSELGITHAFAASCMDITYPTFKKKISDRELRHSFNEKNLSDLIENISKKYDEIFARYK